MKAQRHEGKKCAAVFPFVPTCLCAFVPILPCPCAFLPTRLAFPGPLRKDTALWETIPMRLLAIALLAALVGCTTTRTMTMMSRPPGAALYIDNVKQDHNPLTVPLTWE